MTPPALIFDFGNVIGYFDFEKATTRLGRKFGVSGRALLDRLRKAGFDSAHGAFERGEIDAEVFTRTTADLVGLTVTHEEFALAWADIFTPNESIIPIIAGLKAQGHRLILGSNTNSIHAAHFRQQFASTLTYFDRLILSFEIGVMKPHPGFYLACAAAAEQPPARCIFIDDLAENIAGAKATGMQGIQYTDADSLVVAFDKLGIHGHP